MRNWRYINAPTTPLASFVFFTISFTTVVPAVFETALLLKALGLFDGINWRRSREPHASTLYGLTLAGLGCMTLVVLSRTYFSFLIWFGFIFLFDAINHLRAEPSLIGRFVRGDGEFFLRFAFAGLICGFFWEFWNNWAFLKWIYTLPWPPASLLIMTKVFEMPLLGYLMYIPFALELYALYMFATSLHPSLKRLRMEL